MLTSVVHGARHGACGRGRPRDPAIDELVVRATVELLAERGYDATTVQEISRPGAGVHTAAIYRRWPNRIAR